MKRLITVLRLIALWVKLVCHPVKTLEAMAQQEFWFAECEQAYWLARRAAARNDREAFRKHFTQHSLAVKRYREETKYLSL